MPTQAEIQSGYDTALRSYYNYCATRRIQPDQAYINNLLMSYGFPPQAQTLPRTDIIQAETQSQISQNEIKEQAREFDINNATLLKGYELDYQKGREMASIAAQASAAAAAAGAEADKYAADQDLAAAQAQCAAAIESANIAAAASRYSDDIKAEIAREQRQLDREKYMAVELARPGNWVERVGFYKGQTPEQAAELAKYAGSTVYGGQLGGLPQAQPATAGAAPVAAQAVVGEQGPELATATPQGTQISPLKEDQARYLRGQLPEMAYGGTVRSELLNPSQMLQRMGSYARTPAEYQASQETGSQWMAGGTGSNPGWRQESTPTGNTLVRTTTPGLPMVHPGGSWAGTGTPAGGTPGGTTTPIVGPGGTQPAGDTGAPATPGNPTGSPIDQLPMFQAARAGGQYNVAPFQAWTGPTRNTVTGVEIPPPWQMNLMQFQNSTRAEQAMMAAHWRSMLMIPGETEEEMIANAYDAMRRSAFTGMASTLPQYAGMR